MRRVRWGRFTMCPSGNMADSSCAETFLPKKLTMDPCDIHKDQDRPRILWVQDPRNSTEYAPTVASVVLDYLYFV